jgi:hypothetical protein
MAKGKRFEAGENDFNLAPYRALRLLSQSGQGFRLRKTAAP